MVSMAGPGKVACFCSLLDGDSDGVGSVRQNSPCPEANCHHNHPPSALPSFRGLSNALELHVMAWRWSRWWVSARSRRRFRINVTCAKGFCPHADRMVRYGYFVNGPSDDRGQVEIDPRIVGDDLVYGADLVTIDDRRCPARCCKLGRLLEQCCLMMMTPAHPFYTLSGQTLGHLPRSVKFELIRGDDLIRYCIVRDAAKPLGPSA